MAAGSSRDVIGRPAPAIASAGDAGAYDKTHRSSNLLPARQMVQCAVTLNPNAAYPKRALLHFLCHCPTEDEHENLDMSQIMGAVLACCSSIRLRSRTRECCCLVGRPRLEVDLHSNQGGCEWKHWDPLHLCIWQS